VRIFAGAVLAALVCAACGAAASAAETYDYSFSFGGTGPEALGYAAGIAVDNSNSSSAGDVYVADISNHRIEKFSPSGEFILMFGAGAWPAFVAVDSSSGPSAGDVYVADEETLRVSKFDPTGALLTGWGEDGHLAFPESIGGIAVGSNGDLFVQSGRFSSATISVYEEGGSQLSSFPISAVDETGIAVDGSGDVYFSSADGIEKYEPPATDLGLIDSEESAEAVAIDPSDGDLFVKHRKGLISEFDTECAPSSCAPLASFGSGYLEADFGWLGIAVDASTHAVFATDHTYTGGQQATVAVFYPAGVVPGTTTLSSGPITESTAEVLGLVDPAGAGPVTDCHFEYVDEFDFNEHGGYGEAQSTPCDPEPPYSAAVHVSAALSGLEHDTTYRYRLVTANARGRSYGESETFKTDRALPSAATGAVVSLEPGSAKVSATVGPGPGPPVGLCSFDYVSAASYASSGWASAQVTPCEPPPQYSTPTPVTAELVNLSPNTAYRYRVIALSSEGQSDGEDRQFVTPGNPPIARPQEEPEEESIPDPTGPVHCTKHACSRTFHGSPAPMTWQSPRFPVAYGWQAAIRSHGHWLPHTHLIGGCVAMFRGKSVVARLNGCHGHVKLRYVGDETFTLFWQVFK
jgi:DNA-binding beta-propeller fold protein YncE